MQSGVAPTLIMQTLGQATTLINNEPPSREPFSLSIFLKIASAIIKQLRERYDNQQEFHLSLENIKLTYNDQTGQYHDINVHRPRVRKSFMQQQNQDIYLITPILNTLILSTKLKCHRKIDLLIKEILINELISFEENSFHYENKNAKESLDILAITFTALTTLLSFPKHKLPLLDIEAITHFPSIAKMLGTFIQDPDNHTKFDEKLIAFIDGMRELCAMEDFSPDETEIFSPSTTPLTLLSDSHSDADAAQHTTNTQSASRGFLPAIFSSKKQSTNAQSLIKQFSSTVRATLYLTPREKTPANNSLPSLVKR